MKGLLMILLVLAVSCKSGPSDNELQTNVTSSLNATYPGITASVNKGVVTLSGTCPDAACVSGSEAAARNTKGVKNVVNNISLAAPATPTVEVTADTPLRDSLNTLLSAYKGVQGEVNNGVVTLTGTIKRSQLTPLMQSVNELKPKKVENKLTIQ